MSFMNLGLVKYQNRIAIIAGSHLTEEELEKIDLSKVVYSVKRNISIPAEKIYSIAFDSGIKIEILDIVHSNQYIMDRFTCIRTFNTEGSIQLDIKCKHNKNNIQYLEMVLAKAINFIKYRNQNEYRINHSNLINNFTNKLLSIINNESAMEINFLLNILLTNEEFINNNNFEYSYGIGDINMKIFVKNKNIIVFIVTNSAKNKTEYMYFPFNKIGKWIKANDLIYGLERRKNTDFIVTSGISDWAIKFKTGTKSEFVIINIRKGN